MGAKLMTIAAEGDRRRIYLAPTPAHEQAADVPIPNEMPDTELPEAALGFRVQGYGMTRHADLFTSRQQTALTTFSGLVGEARARVLADARSMGLPDGEPLDSGGFAAQAYADSIAVYLAEASSRIASTNSTLCRWRPDPAKESVNDTFGRQALSMTWDFAEGNPFVAGPPAFVWSVAWVARALERLGGGRAYVEQANAAGRAYRGMLVSTDPPYYDNVGYADLSDYFYIWLRESLGSVYPVLLGTMLTPKADELVADPFRRGGTAEAQRFFEDGFIRIFENIRRDAVRECPTAVFYAFKQSESDDDGSASTGWQTLLEGMIRSGWEVTATWPIRTELGNRMRSLGSNALASSIVLACRPRSDSAEAISRRGFIAAMKAELPRALKTLEQASIAPVDLAQAAIGPGMAVFSRYSRVVETDGSDMSVRTALALINQVLDEVLSAQEGDFDADTRFAVTWFDQFGWNEADFGRADDLARSRNTSVEGLVRGGIFWARSGKARLVAPEDLSPDWHPATDERLSVWEVALRLAQALATDGVEAASRLMAASSQRVDLDAVKELAYLLFSLSEKRSRAETALLFNQLGSSWSDLAAAARSASTSGTATQQTLL